MKEWGRCSLGVVEVVRFASEASELPNSTGVATARANPPTSPRDAPGAHLPPWPPA